MISPILLSAAFGFIKGFTSSEPSTGFDVEQDLWGPTKEELIFRGPLWIFPKVPYGATALFFAGEHILSDQKESPQMTPLEVVARLGDVFLGGMLYELAMRRGGMLSAIGAHAAHNNAIRWGEQLRNGVKRGA